MNGLSEVVIHINEAVDAAALDDLERNLRQARGVVAVGHRPDRNHLLLVKYDTSLARASHLLQPFQQRGLHAQLIGM